MEVRVQGAAGRAATGAAGRTPLPVPKYPWRYAEAGELPSGVLGATDKAGNVVVRRGLGAAKEAEVLRHEFGHRWLTPLGEGSVATARQNVSAWFYEHSAALRVLEEGTVHTYATRSPLAGARLALSPGYAPLALGPGDIVVAGLVGGTVYAGYMIVEDDR